MAYKDELQMRLSALLKEANDEGGKEYLGAWGFKFINDVARTAHREGILSLSPKQISKIEELYDRYCT